jgi:DNA-binding MurR/RpiR family transcriptional regulator
MVLYSCGVEDLAALFRAHRLTPAQRRIAQYLLDHADEAAYASSGRIAASAGVSQPSVTRFAVALGFDGYAALRQRIRALGPPRDHGRPPATAAQRAVAAETRNLARLADALADPGPVADAGRALMASVPLPVLGLRASAPLAGHFAYFAGSVHPDVRLIDAGGSLLVEQLERAADAGATALLAFALPRCPRETVDALATARELGLRAVLVVDTPLGPAADHADLVLAAPVGTDLVFDSQAAPTVLATVLLQAMCDAEPAATRARLERADRSTTRRKVFT